MSILGLFFVAIGACTSLLILLSYAPIHSITFGKSHSPRLFFARLVAPFDIGITLILVMGTLVGFTAVTGIGNIVFNVATGLGLSMGSLIVRKLLVPRWTNKYLTIKEQIPKKARVIRCKQ